MNRTQCSVPTLVLAVVATYAAAFAAAWTIGSYVVERIRAS